MTKTAAFYFKQFAHITFFCKVTNNQDIKVSHDLRASCLHGKMAKKDLNEILLIG